MKITLNAKGFTLIEVVIVVVILSILSSLAMPKFIKYRRRSQATGCLANLKQLQTAIEQCRLAGKPASEENIFGPDGLLKKKPVCPAGGTYILPDDNEDVPTCTFKERDSDDVMTWHQFNRSRDSDGK